MALRWRHLFGSLRTRIAVGFLLGAMLAVWGSTISLGYMLRQEMLSTLSAQQYSVVSLLADEIDRSVEERLRAVEVLAKSLDEGLLADPDRLQRLIANQPVLLSLFNWGVMVTDEAGTALVDYPEAFRRKGINYGDEAVIEDALRTGRSAVGAAVMGRTTHQPLVPLIAPVKGVDGKVIGTVIGFINLAAPNFLDEIGANRFGRQGGYLITEPQRRIFIAGTDKSRVMQPGPPPGINPVYDRYIAGEEGSGIARSSRGVVELSSSRKVRTTGWLMQSVLPLEEALAPMYAQQWRLVAVAAMLTLLFSGLAWWWLRRELRPLAEASDMLAAMRDGAVPRQALPIHRDDEIGALAGAFNGLLATIEEGEARAAEHNFNQRLRAIVAQVPGVVFQYRIDAEGQHSLPYVSDAVRDAWGLSPDDLVHDIATLHSVVHQDDREGFAEALSTSAHCLGPWRMEFRIWHPGRGLRWMRLDALPEAGADGVTWQGFVMDITEEKVRESELRIAAATFETQEGIFITDAKERIVRVNQAFTAMTGYTVREAVGQTPALLKSGHHSPEFYRNLREGLERDGFWQGEMWNRRKNGEIFVEWVTISTVRDDHGRLTHYVAAFSDITEHKKAEEQIHQLAFYDPLTHLPNRRLFHDRFEQALVLGARTGNRGALIFLDLDGFKGLNDSRGHVVGDQLLVEVARRLSMCVRESDTVARLGGDEFVVILEDLDEDESEAAAHAGRVAEKLRDVLGQPYLLSEPASGEALTHRCTASIGVCLFQGHGLTRDELIRRADVAMYGAKSAGRNTVRFFSSALDTRAGAALQP